MSEEKQVVLTPAEQKKMDKAKLQQEQQYNKVKELQAASEKRRADIIDSIMKIFIDNEVNLKELPEINAILDAKINGVVGGYVNNKTIKFFFDKNK